LGESIENFANSQAQKSEIPSYKSPFSQMLLARPLLLPAEVRDGNPSGSQSAPGPEFSLEVERSGAKRLRKTCYLSIFFSREEKNHLPTYRQVGSWPESVWEKFGESSSKFRKFANGGRPTADKNGGRPGERVTARRLGKARVLEQHPVFLV
jgi:hypothetical protein